ncbi:actin-related protein 10-like [Sinocyclocheilus anshuiensis]|uniref:actin-related protein 10-like n=1 Tax=Sinocyclocheilus anshuiensis TaxID=1608454 RepID=UPI0007B99548|nr:PREDICTED: actin-related protein 10-like [Sinocyclocheilus anshuiensis]
MPLFEGLGSGGEKTAVVVDLGAAYTKCGFAGETGPRFVIPSEIKRAGSPEVVRVVQYNINTEELYSILKEFVHLLYFRHLLVNPRDRRVVIVESILCPSHFRETLSRVFFKHFEVPSVMFAPSHLMSVMTLGIQSALVMDCGYTETLVLPIYEGIPILSAWEALPMGGKAIHRELHSLLSEQCTLDTDSSAGLSLPTVVSSIPEEVVEDIKVRTCFVSDLQRGMKIQEAKFNMDGSAEVREHSQERLDGAEAGGLSDRFSSSRLRGRRWGNGRPRAPQTVGGGGRPGSLLLLAVSFLGKERSLGQEGLGGSRALLAQTERWERQGEKLVISVILSHKWRSAATEPAIEHPIACAVCLVALRAKSVALRSSLTASGVRSPPSSISLRTSACIHLVRSVFVPHQCPVDTRKVLSENLVIIGGTAMLPGFLHRLLAEIRSLVEKPKYHDALATKSFRFHSPPAKPNCTAWLGGAIFGALQDILGSRSVSRDYYSQTGRIPDWCCLSTPLPDSVYEAGKTPPPFMKRAFSTEK